MAIHRFSAKFGKVVFFTAMGGQPQMIGIGRPGNLALCISRVMFDSDSKFAFGK